MAALPPRDAQRIRVASGVVVLFCLAAYLPGFFALPTVDRDEARFAQTSRQMSEAGTWEAYITPQIQDRLRLNKPPLSYWLQAAAARAALLVSPPGREGEEGAIWPYRVPSLLAAIAAVLVTAHLGRSMFGPPAGWLGAALLAASPLVAWEARQARADQLLLAFTVIAQTASWSIWRERQRPSSSWNAAALFWIATGLGALTKGPITPALVAMTIVGQSVRFGEWRWIGRFHPWAGLGILAALLVPWTFLLAQRVGWNLYLTTLYDEIIGRSMVPREGHWGPPGYHLAFLLILFWPGWLMGPAVVATIATWARGFLPRGSGAALRSATPPEACADVQEAQAFCLAWALPGWLCFELVQTKLPHYPLPLYPALALLTGAAIVGAGPRAALKGGGATLWRVIGALLVIAAPLGVWFGGALTGDAWLMLPTLAAMLAGTGLLVMATRAARRTHLAAAILLAIPALVIAESTVCTWLPHLTPLWLTPRLVALVAAADPTRSRPLAAVEYQEDSLIFASAGRVQRIAAPDLGRWLRAHRDGLAIVPSALAEGAPSLHTLGEVDGFNYSKGQWLHLRLIENAAVVRDPASGTPLPQAP